MYKLTDLYKQLKEEEIENQKTQPIIFCDMDGVICDFRSRFEDLNPEKLPIDDYIAKYSNSKFWKFIDKEIGTKFWSEMEWMSDGKELWGYISKYKPTLLSSPSYNPESRLGKKLWVDKNLPGTKLVLAYSKNKQNYSKVGRILIDDRKDIIEEWNSKGGTGILHTSATNTITQLKENGI